jgi:hypothetical protein
VVAETGGCDCLLEEDLHQGSELFPVGGLGSGLWGPGAHPGLPVLGIRSVVEQTCSAGTGSIPVPEVYGENIDIRGLRAPGETGLETGEPPVHFVDRGAAELYRVVVNGFMPSQTGVYSLA